MDKAQISKLEKQEKKLTRKIKSLAARHWMFLKQDAKIWHEQELFYKQRRKISNKLDKFYDNN
jgi:hypothetical protein